MGGGGMLVLAEGIREGKGKKIPKLHELCMYLFY